MVLAPLFPNGIIEPGEANNYKEIRFYDIRFDHILLGIIDEVAETYRVQHERFMLYGYSGGGQFALRFCYLHPQRLRAVSIGAPGAVTLLDTTQPWWLGVADIEEQFGVELDLQALRSVSVQLLVGGADTEPMDAIDSLRTMPSSERAGATKVERLATLRDSLTKNGIAIEHTVLPGLGHENYKFLPAVTDFFARYGAGSRVTRLSSSMNRLQS
jgi:pimeloyl-ACP methyl ester carboxylesterase